MKHKQILEITEKLISLTQREAAMAELLKQVQDPKVPEIDKVHIISIAETHVFNKASNISGFKSILNFLCKLKHEIKAPHLQKFINEYFCLDNGRLKFSLYVERKLPLTDYFEEGVNLQGLDTIAKEEDFSPKGIKA